MYKERNQTHMVENITPPPDVSSTYSYLLHSYHNALK